VRTCWMAASVAVGRQRTYWGLSATFSLTAGLRAQGAKVVPAYCGSGVRGRCGAKVARYVNQGRASSAASNASRYSIA
jgi:hypothetical protein